LRKYISASTAILASFLRQSSAKVALDTRGDQRSER
jgi:hypothetical protein